MLATNLFDEDEDRWHYVGEVETNGADREDGVEGGRATNHDEREENHDGDNQGQRSERNLEGWVDLESSISVYESLACCVHFAKYAFGGELAHLNEEVGKW